MFIDVLGTLTNVGDLIPFDKNGQEKHRLSFTLMDIEYVFFNDICIYYYILIF